MTGPAEPPAQTAGRQYPARPIVGVGGVILVRLKPDATLGEPDATSGEQADAPAFGVVLIRRRFEPLAGCWSLPGGGLEVGETLQEGLARELREETGLSVEVGPVVDVFDRITRDDQGRVRFHYVLVDFVCWPTGGVLQAGSDVSEAVVADPADLGRFQLAAKTLEVIERALTPSPARGPQS